MPCTECRGPGIQNLTVCIQILHLDRSVKRQIALAANQHHSLGEEAPRADIRHLQIVDNKSIIQFPAVHHVIKRHGMRCKRAELNMRRFTDNFHQQRWKESRRRAFDRADRQRRIRDLLAHGFRLLPKRQHLICHFQELLSLRGKHHFVYPLLTRNQRSAKLILQLVQALADGGLSQNSSVAAFERLFCLTMDKNVSTSE